MKVPVRSGWASGCFMERFLNFKIFIFGSYLFT
jgi:hypothetical protein